MIEKNIALKSNYDIAKMSDMAEMANILKAHIVKNKLYTNIQGKNYAHVDGWTFAGGLMGILPRVAKVENLSSGTEKKWKADVEIVRLKDDKVLGYGFAICSSLEGKKKSFDEYAILSMAQTRATGKAYRNLIGWIMKLGGMESTPAEEMVKVDTPIVSQNQPQINQDEKHYECHEGAEIITKAEYDYSMKMYKKPLCRQHQTLSKKSNSTKAK